MPSNSSEKNRAALMQELGRVKKHIAPAVKKRLRELACNKDWFSELCFCILTANYTAEGGMRIQKACDFSNMSEEQTRIALHELGHRFPNARASYIALAKTHKEALEGLKNMRSSYERREWLVKNVKGIGYKEASHFLRNVGFMDVAIVDRHIMAVLGDYGIVKRPKTLGKKTYMEIESKLNDISRELGVSQGELDFYIWFIKTGKVLK